MSFLLAPVPVLLALTARAGTRLHARRMDVPASGVAGIIFALLQPVGPEGLGRSALLRRQIIQELQRRVPNSGESTGRGASTGVNGELDQGEIAPLPQMAVDGLKDARPPDFRGLGILVAFVSPGTNDVGKIGNANAVREDLLARGLQAACLVSMNLQLRDSCQVQRRHTAHQIAQRAHEIQITDLTFLGDKRIRQLLIVRGIAVLAELLDQEATGHENEVVLRQLESPIEAKTYALFAGQETKDVT